MNFQLSVEAFWEVELKLFPMRLSEFPKALAGWNVNNSLKTLSSSWSKGPGLALTLSKASQWLFLGLVDCFVSLTSFGTQAVDRVQRKSAGSFVSFLGLVMTVALAWMTRARVST